MGDDLQLPPGYTLDSAPVSVPKGYKLDPVDLGNKDSQGNPLPVFKQTPVDIPMQNRDGQIKQPEEIAAPSGFEKAAMAPLEYLKNGMEQLGQGLHGLTHPQSGDQMAGAGSDVIRGGLQTMTPFFAPEMAARPLATMLGFGTFGAADATVEGIAGALRVPEGWKHLLGDLVGMYGGAKAYRWLSRVNEISDGRVRDAIYRKLEETFEAAKDPNLTAGDRARLKAQGDALMNSLGHEEGWKIPALFPNPNAAERDAYGYMRDTVGVAPNAGAATGSPFVRGTQHLTGMTPAGALMDVAGKKQTMEALRGNAGRLVGEAMPQEGPSRDYYADFERLTNEAPAVEVPLSIGKDGSQITGNVKVPVDIRDLKYEMQPLLEKMEFMPMADRSASSAYSALTKLLKSDDFIPAPTAEWGLSQFKKAARSESGGISEGLAKRVIPHLQAVIDGAVEGHAGDEALNALQQGRAAAAKEAGAEWLSDQFKKAQQEGAFQHEKAIWHSWTTLSETGKRSMFTPEQVAELNKFFLGLKMLAENPNPSGTALVGAIMAQAGYAFHGGVVEPTFWLGNLTTAAIAKLLRSDLGVKLLTDGLVMRNSKRGRFIERKLRDVLGGPEPPESGPPAGGGQPGGQGGGGSAAAQPPQGNSGAPALPKVGDIVEVSPPSLNEMFGKAAPWYSGPVKELRRDPVTGDMAVIISTPDGREMVGTPGYWRSPIQPGGGRSNPARGAFNRAKERAGEFLDSEEGSSPRRKAADPIAAVGLKYLMDNPLEVPANGNKGEVLTLDMGRQIRQTVRSNGGSLAPNSDAGVRQARAQAAMAEDLKYALASQPEARKWYTESVAEMEAELIKHRPEFKDDGKRSLFKYLLGVTSNGVDPELNFDAAVRGWDLYQKHGHFMAYDPDRLSEFADKPGKEEEGTGLTFRANSYKSAMERLDRLVQEKGEAGAAEWLRTKHPIEELKKYEPKITVNDGSLRLGSYVLGEKVGAFGANLNGIYSELTADKWWSRTWNRWMGTTIATDKEGVFKLDKKTGEPLTQDDPRNETERNLMRTAAANVAKDLDLTVAELQAVLWYAEQALYRAHGMSAGSADYSMAAKKFFSKRSASSPGSGPLSSPARPPSDSSRGISR